MRTPMEKVKARSRSGVGVSVGGGRGAGRGCTVLGDEVLEEAEVVLFVLAFPSDWDEEAG